MAKNVAISTECIGIILLLCFYFFAEGAFDEIVLFSLLNNTFGRPNQMPDNAQCRVPLRTCVQKRRRCNAEWSHARQ